MTSPEAVLLAKLMAALASADAWSALVRLRSRLAHEYPVNPTAQLERLADAFAAVPTLHGIRDGLGPTSR